jgi:hypothetical protein
MMPAGAMGPPRRAGDTTVRSVNDLHSERTVVLGPPHPARARRVYGAGGYSAGTRPPAARSAWCTGTLVPGASRKIPPGMSTFE